VKSDDVCQLTCT